MLNIQHLNQNKRGVRPLLYFINYELDDYTISNGS